MSAKIIKTVEKDKQKGKKNTLVPHCPHTNLWTFPKKNHWKCFLFGNNLLILPSILLKLS